MNELAGLMAYEISHDLPLEVVEVETPVSITRAKQLSKEVVLVPILRAGLGMVDGILNLISDARVGHIGIASRSHTMKSCPWVLKMPLLWWWTLCWQQEEVQVLQ